MILGSALGKAGQVASGYLNMMGTDFAGVAEGIAKSNLKSIAPDFIGNALNLTADDFVEAGSRTIYKGMVKEMGSALSSNRNLADVSSEMYDIMGRAAKNDKNLAAKLTSPLSSKDGFENMFRKAFDSAPDEFKSIYGATRGENAGYIKDVANNIKSTLKHGTLEERGKMAGNVAQSYFLGGDMKRNVARIGTGYAGAVGVMNVVGNADHHRQDIIGVPFF